MKPKQITYRVLFSLLLVFIVLALSRLMPSTMATNAEALGEAAPGESMRIHLNHVAPDKRTQFEEYVYDILMPAVEKVAETNATQRSLLKKTRMLEPRQANKDGSYTYVWLMDPVVEDGDYTYRGILSKVYSPEKTEKYLSMVNDCLTTPQVVYRVKESSRW